MSEWISVGDRLPKVGDRVLIFNGCVYEVVKCKEGFNRFGLGVDNATHWMPLPEPPQDK